MSDAFLIQLAASGLAVALLVGLAAWASIGRPNQPLTDAKARSLFDEEFPGRALDGVWVAEDGKGALAKSGAAALVLCRFGDGFVARQIPWGQALASAFRKGELCIDLADIAAPRAVLALRSWPPTDLGGKDLAA
ncbi:hypothetical protein [Phenylobacterium sp. J367]|uniref:hypothetical protein n=1 Tax=Phenylobacterium sp. J367 TaxID=2898435 RepID=UPI002150AC1A|nr:hypothetical protein [Phenylobacterium sp. J367]MCR5880015.1 hypothetical protein [Phenylobacterium sp. J367]